MLRSLKALQNYSIHGLDGDIGRLERLLFDYHQGSDKWIVRYLLIKTGHFFKKKKILMSTQGLKKIDWPASRFEVMLTRDLIERSPDIDTELPLARQKEKEYFDYYRWPYYWTHRGIWGVAPLSKIPSELERRDPHLTSSHEVLECRIEAQGTDSGRVTDLLVDDDHWFFRYLVVELHGARLVLLPIGMVDSVRWDSRVILVDLPVEMLQGSPVFDPQIPMTREFESGLRRYYEAHQRAS